MKITVRLLKLPIITLRESIFGTVVKLAIKLWFDIRFSRSIKVAALVSHSKRRLPARLSGAVAANTRSLGPVLTQALWVSVCADSEGGECILVTSRELI